ncbi:MAG: DUF3520 domain-containing protein [Candidatus Devosia symbiotica]|nr:DUF3520 domain-containing protein [Candidatus Devosia symbiotica]
MAYRNIDEVGPEMRFAAEVAAFGQKLRGSDFGSNMSWSDIAALARSGRDED